jgi:formyltetrahydrofolate-dependent phosphoribosylglycinamide formyltransferase
MPVVQIAVLASGRGSNLQALLDVLEPASSPGRVALVVSNRADAGALTVARAAGVVAETIGDDGQDSATLLEHLRAHDSGLIVLAGYLKRVPDAVISAYRGRVLNIHPALLPAFGGPGMYGRRVHEAVLASGARVSGATVHAVDEVYDRGPILAQWPVPVRPGDTPETLAERVLLIEHRLLPAVVQAVCRQLTSAAEPPRALCAAADAFVLSQFPETDLGHALVSA